MEKKHIERLDLKKLFKSKSFWEYCAIVIFAVGLFIGLRITVQDYVVISSSMENTLRVNEMVLVDKLAYKFGEPQRGNIIMFHGPNPPITSTIPLVKRIIGLPGEKVEISDSTVKIIRADGSSMILNEPYIKEPPSYTFDSSVIPENEYFVLGDNRNNSEDSHYNYLVSRSEIIGRAWLCIWPPSSWGLVHNYSKYAVTTVTAVR